MLRRYQTKKEQGVTLIEMMISITIGLILIAGITTIYAKIGAAGVNNIANTRLNQQMRSLMDFMSRDLRKAGFVNSWNAGPGNLTGVDLLKIARFGPVLTGGTCSAGKCSCVVYSYDRNSDSLQGVGPSGTVAVATEQNTANFELFGFKLDGTVLDSRSSGSPQGCASGDWEALSDGEIIITTLTFELDSADTVDYNVGGNSVTPSTCVAGTMCLQRRKLNIVMTAELANDSSVSATLTQQIQIKNDYLFTTP
ncbi:MAG: prepilin peptidase dependent protein B [Halieaceae bacterium]|jgi:prepilin peptidase dependent protein B